MNFEGIFPRGMLVGPEPLKKPDPTREFSQNSWYAPTRLLASPYLMGATGYYQDLLVISSPAMIFLPHG